MQPNHIEQYITTLRSHRKQTSNHAIMAGVAFGLILAGMILLVLLSSSRDDSASLSTAFAVSTLTILPFITFTHQIIRHRTIAETIELLQVI